jgi:hypothetical protein
VLDLLRTSEEIVDARAAIIATGQPGPKDNAADADRRRDQRCYYVHGLRV